MTGGGDMYSLCLQGFLHSSFSWLLYLYQKPKTWKSMRFGDPGEISTSKMRRAVLGGRRDNQGIRWRRYK
jgi:hypothetical protein